mgnify:CR=1 FL=1
MKNFLLAGRCAVLCGLVMVASCNKSKGTLQSDCGDSNEIRFGSNGIRVETKSFTETTNSLLQANGFKAAVVVDADNSVMFNVAVAYDSTDAVYRVSGEHYYYPSEGTVSLYGVYPSSEIISVDSGAATVAYTHNPDEDLVGAKAVAVARQSAPVHMDFEHLLSQVTMTVKTDNPNTLCKLYGITLTDAEGGVYAFTDDSWTPGGTVGNYVFFSSPDGQNVTTVASEVGEVMSFIPGTISLNVKWKCYNLTSGEIVSDNDKTVSVELTKGKHSTLNLTLPANSSELMLVTTVVPWVEESQDIEVEAEVKEFVFTVDNEGKKVKFSPGNLYWDGSKFCFEEHQYDYPTSLDANHRGHFFWSKDARVAYSDDYDTANSTYGITPTITDTFFAADGGAITGWTVLSSDEWQYLIDNKLAANSEIKYYNDDNSSGEFYFTGTYAEAKAEYDSNYDYLYGEFDKAIANGFIEAWDVFSHEINGVSCAILKPDGFSGTVADTYTAIEWAAAEAAGLVALPFAGCRYNSDVRDTGSRSSCWSSTQFEDEDGDGIYYAYFKFHEASMGGYNCDAGLSVRLVQVVE